MYALYMPPLIKRGEKQGLPAIFPHTWNSTFSIFFFGGKGKYFEATPKGLKDALDYYGVKQIELAIKSRVNKGYISQFLNKKKGYRKGLNARIWIAFAYALNCKFYIKKRVENDTD